MTLTAADLMTGDIQLANASWSLRELVQFLSRNEISGAPVVADGGQQLIGVVSLTDVARSAKRDACHFDRSAKRGVEKSNPHRATCVRRPWRVHCGTTGRRTPRDLSVPRCALQSR